MNEQLLIEDVGQMLVFFDSNDVQICFFLRNNTSLAINNWIDLIDCADTSARSDGGSETSYDRTSDEFTQHILIEIIIINISFNIFL